MENEQEVLTKISNEEKGNKRLEIFVLIVALLCCTGIFTTAALTSDQPISSAFDFLRNIGVVSSRNVALNCQNPKNKNTPYCQDRAASVQSDWKGVSVGGGKSNVFTLHNK